MRGKRHKNEKRISKVYLLAISTITILISIFGYKVTVGKENSKAMQTNLKESYMSALSNSEINTEIDDTKQKTISTDGDYIYLSDMEYTPQSSTGWRNIQKDKNPDERTIQLRKGGELVSYAKGMGFHANGQLIYDITEYSDKFTRFIADIGVDASKPDTASIKVQVFVSEDLNKWDELEFKKSNQTLKAKDECVSVDLKIEGKKYLKITVNNAGDGNASDHCVLGDARIAKTNYDVKSELYSNIEPLNEYDKKISEETKIEEVYNNYEMVLEREFVNKFGYWSIQNYCRNETLRNAIEWVLNDKTLLEMVIEVGEISDGNSFFEVLGNLYKERKDVLQGNDKELYEKMMVGLAAAYSTDYMSMATSFGIVKPNYDYVERFDIMKDLYNGKEVGGKVYKFEYPDQFKKLHVDLIRNIMNIGLRNDEILWMNYHSTTKDQKNKFNCHAYLPYKIPVYKDDYYNESFKEFYDNKYQLTQFNVPFADGRVNRDWMIIDNGGVCWNISRIGQAVFKANGIPAIGLYQPAHEPFMNYTEENGKGVWKMQYNVGGWGKAGTTWGGGGRYRLTFDWGNKYFADQNIGGSKGGTSSGYEILAQANLNDYDNYKKSLYYNLLANSYTDFESKEKIYMKALEEEKLNLDSYDELINLYKEEYADKSFESGENWCNLAEKIIENYTYYPNALHDLMEVIMPYIEEIAKEDEKIAAREFFIKNNMISAYNKACNANSTQSIQYAEIMQIAGRYIDEPEEIATFSFDGEHGNQIVLNEQYIINYAYSIDYDEENPDNATWSEFSTERYRTLTDDELKKINSTNDIVIKMTGTDNKYKIDIEEAFTWHGYFEFMNYYNNDLENTMCEAGPNVEWCYIENGEPIDKNEDGEPAWKSFEKEEPDLTGDKIIRIRLGRSGNNLASIDYKDYEFTKDEEDNRKKYIPISEVNFAFGTEEAEIYHGDYAINGNYLKGYASSNLKDKKGDNFLVYELSYPRVLSAVDYIPDCEDYGQMLSGKILGSMDGENWSELASLENITYTNENLKKYMNDGCSSNFGLVNIKTFKIPDENKQKVRFIKIVSNESKQKENKNKGSENIFSARMFNFYEDTEFVTKETKGEPEANIVYSTTKPTKNSVEAKIVSRSSKDVEVVGDEYTHTFTTNGTYTFNLVDAEGRKGKAIANVTWIDNKVDEPSVEFSTNSPTNGEVEAILKPTEDIIVLGTDFIIEDNVLKYAEINSKGNTVYTACKDFNEGFSIHRDKDCYIDDDGSVVVTNKGEISKVIPNKVEDTETGIIEENVLYKHKFITNDTYKFEYVDMFGNVGEKEVTVDWIDNTAPIGKITYSTTSTSEDPVKATISFENENGEEDNIEILNVGTNSDTISYIAGSNEVTFLKNGKFIFEFKDKAGNVSETEAEVTWIERMLDSTEYEIKAGKVKKVNPNTNLKELTEKLQSRFGITILDSKGEPVTDIEDEESYAKTGMKVSVNGNTYIIIVSGDIDGDGKLTQTDLDKMCKHFLESQKVEGIYLEAGDYDNSGDITLKDIAKMYSLINKDNLNKINTKRRTLSAKSNSENKLIAYISTQNLDKAINAIGGKISYNKDVLQLEKIESENAEWKLERNNDKIIALRKKASTSNEEVIKLTFSIKESSKKEIEVDLSNIKISDGEFEETAENKLKINYEEPNKKVPVESVEISSTSEKFKDGVASIEVSEEISFHAIILPDHATETKVTWSLGTGADQYISIDENGKVKAKKITDDKGVKIKATVDGKYAECTIKVIPTEVTGISHELSSSDIYLVEPNTEGAGENTSVKVVVNVLPDNATNKSVKWESSDTSVATVDNNGVITAVADEDNEEETRTCTITVTSESNKKVSKQYTVYVNDHLEKVTGVEIKLPEGKKDGTIILGETLELKAEISPNNANFKEIEWSVVEGEDIIEVSTSGHIHTKKEGNAKVKVTVKCQAKDCPEHTAQIEIKVLPKPEVEVTKVEIQGEKEVTLQELKEMKLHVIVSPDDATNKSVTWESSNSQVVSVTEDGMLFANSVGTATITAKCGNVSDTINVKVEAILKTDLTVYAMTQDKKFITGIILKLDKILDELEIKIDEQTTNGKFDFNDLEDGEYILRAFKPFTNKKTKSTNNNELVIEYKFEVKNGKVIFKKENSEDILVNSLVFIIPTDSGTTAKVDNGNDYPNIDKEYEDFVKSLAQQPEGETKPGGETKPTDETNKGEGIKPSDATKQDDDSQQNDNNSNNFDGEANNFENSNSTPKTSDISIEIFIIMMIVSLTGIVCIIYSNKKHTKSKKKHAK